MPIAAGGNLAWLRQVAETWARGDTEAIVALVQGRLAADFELHPLYIAHV
jgi:hypothetical protein